MKNKIIIITLFISLTFPLNENSKKNENEISNDSLATLINEKMSITSDSLAKLIDNKVEQVLDEVYYVDHLKSKVSGFEFSPAALLIGSINDILWFNFSYSRYDINEMGEVIFPVSIRKNYNDEDLREWFMIDYQYRHFMGINTPRKYRKGFFVLSGAKACYSKDMFDSNDPIGIGLYVGIGGRRFSKNTYWGWNIIAGRYLNQDYPIFNFEFLKFGWYIK